MLRIFNIVFFLLNIVLVGALLLSYSAVYISPDVFYLPAFFGLAYPFILLANILVMIWWLAQLKFKFLFSLLAILPGWIYVGKIVQVHHKPNVSSTALKVMSYNVAGFGFEANTKNWDVILKFITDEQPDILCLQEYINNVNWNVQLERTFAEAMNAEHYFFNNLSHSRRNYQGGTLIISRFPIVDTGHVLYHMKTGNSTAFADLDINGVTVRVFNVHLQSIRFKPNDYEFINSLGEANDQALEGSKSMIAQMRRAYELRAKQVKLVREAIQASPHKVLVCGDFNDTPVSFAYTTMQEGLKDAFVESGSGLGRTYAGAFPGFRIDYILSDPKFDVSGFEVMQKKFSDHYPIKAYISLKP